ncbi:MAG TPA: MASE1 domain-containing protein [Candidatus Paceibacterota bacterium]|jgi:PAS domain S-box-containing protein|nr:MASE1 domain-containing protein [Candidatus Paceibacterota bacterium]
MKKLKQISLFLLVLAAYIISGKLGLQLASIQANATPIWAPAGIATAALLILGYRFWPAIFLGAFITNITTGGTPVAATLAIAIGNTLEALLAAYLVNRFANGVRALDKTDNVFRFAFLAGGVSPMVSATIGVTSLFLAGSLHAADFTSVWSTWWLGDVGGMLIIAPFLLAWFTDHAIEWSTRKILEVVALAALLFAFALFAFKGTPGFIFVFYLFIPVFVWVAFRFSQRETATVLFAMTEITLYETLHGEGPFINAATTLNAALLLFQAAMVTIAITMFALSAASAEERKHAVATIRANERMEQEKAVDAAIIASVGDGLIVTDQEGNIALVNPQAEKFLGWRAEEIVGKKYYDVIQVQNEDGVTVALSERPLVKTVAERKRIASGPMFATRYYVRKDGGRFPVSFTKTPVMLGGEVIGTIEIFRDATKGVEIDRTKSEFVSLAAHQLRTPLSIIAMHAELLKKQGQLFGNHDEEMCVDYATEIHDVAMRMADLINDLLNVSRIDTQTLVVTPGSVNVRRLVDGILREMAFKFSSRNITVRTNYPDPAPELVTDPHLLEIIVENLLGNAVKYTPEGGRVSIVVREEELDIVVTITDTGHGIPHAQHGEVFKKFFRADNARRMASEGTGLGLYIVKSVVERLGGSISFESREGEGTSFVVHIPKTSAEGLGIPEEDDISTLAVSSSL